MVAWPGGDGTQRRPMSSGTRGWSSLTTLVLWAMLLGARPGFAADSPPGFPGLLACRFANYQEFESAAWTNLPALGVTNVFMSVPAPDQADAILGRLRAHGLRALVLRGDGDVSQTNGVDRLATQLATCERMGVRYLFLSVKRQGVDKEIIYARLRQAGEIAARHHVTIAMETHPDLCTNSDLQRETMLRINHPNVRINFDTGNIHFYNRGRDAAAELRRIIDFVATVEVKDHNGEFEGWNFPALGRGIVKFPEVLAVLREHGYHGPVTIEIEGIKDVHRSQAEVERDIAESVRYLRSLSNSPTR